MAKPPQTPAQKQKAGNAFNLYMTVDELGKRRTIKDIAQALGCTTSAVQYWKQRDRWDERLSTVGQAKPAETQATANRVKGLLRASLVKHIESLNTLIESAPKASDRIKAIKEFVHIAKELDVLTPDGSVTQEPMTTFKDDIEHDGPRTDSGTGEGSRTLEEIPVLPDGSTDPELVVDIRELSGAGDGGSALAGVMEIDHV